MRLGFAAVAAFAATLLGSCGGGDGDNPDPGPDTSLPTLEVTLSETEKTVAIPEGGAATFSFNASYTGTSSDPIVADVLFSARRYRLVGTPTANGTTFTVNFETVPFPAGGLTTSQILFRLCTTDECTRIYPGSAKNLTLYLDVQLKDWETQQRTAAHRGHVDAVYAHADFAKKWEYAGATGSQIGAVAATRDGVFVTESGAADGKFFAVGLDSTNGSSRWRVDMGTNPASDPAFFEDKAYYTQTAANGTRQPLAIGERSGAQTTLPAYQTAAGRMNQPVPFANALHLIAGANGKVAHSYNLANSTLAWAQDFGGAISDKGAVAVDDNYVYAFNGPSIVLLNRASGTIAGTLGNADFTTGSVWNSAPLLDGDGRVIALTRSHEFNEPSPLAAWSVAAGTRLWQSTELYTGAPALSQEYLYAVNTGQRRVDAINPATGGVAFSLAIPGTDALTGSVVTTRSHLFVSTAGNVYAFHLTAANRPQVWTNAVGGRLAITPDNLLIVSGGNKVTAFRLW